MAKILIVGCGDVGGRLAERLLADGETVYALQRSQPSVPGVQHCPGDVTQPHTLQLPAALDYVFVALAPRERGEEAYRQVYWEGTRHVLAALQGQAIKRVFWVSSSSVYGQNDGSWVNEDSPALGSSASSRLLLASEALVQASAWPATVVRMAGIYGPGRLRLPRWVEEGRPVQAEPPAWTNRIHVDDAAGLLHFLWQHDVAGDVLAPVYIGSDDEPVPQHVVLDWLAAYMQLAAVPHEHVAQGEQNKRLSNQKIRTAGYVFRYPDFRSGYAAVLA